MKHPGQFKPQKWKPSRALHKKNNPAELANSRRAIGTSNNFVNNVPRRVRHLNAADLPQEGNPRKGLLLTALLATQFALDAQAEMNMRTRPYTHKGSPIIPEPPSSNGADTTPAPSGMPTRPATNGTSAQSNPMDAIAGQPFAYGNGTARNMTFTQGDHESRSGRQLSTPPTLRALSSDLTAESSPTPSPGPAEGAPVQPTSLYGTGANDLFWSALDWLNPFLDNSADDDYQPSAWPLPGGHAQNHHRRRGDAHHSHHPPTVDAAGYPVPHSMRNATIYPSEKLSEEMHSLINSVASFETLLAEPLRKLGYDPNEGLPFDITYLGQQHHHGSTKTLTASEVVQHFTTSQRSGLHLMGQSPRATKLVQLINDEKYKKNSGENFLTVEALNPLKHNHRKKITNAIRQKFEAFGIDGEDTVLLREVKYRKRTGDMLGGAQHHTKSVLGAIVDIEKNGKTKRYAIVPHHPDYVIHIPSDDMSWIQWMKDTGKSLFFRNPDAIPSHAHFATEVKPRSEDRRTRTVESAISHTVKPIVEKTIEHMTALVTNDTPIEEAYHSILGLYIPYYDFGKSLIQKDFKGAVLFLALEFMPKAASGSKQIVRGVFRGARIGQTVDRALDSEVIPAVYSRLKDMLGFSSLAGMAKPVEKVAGRAAKPAGRLAIDQTEARDRDE